jgi:hypothetical protein
MGKKGDDFSIKSGSPYFDKENMPNMPILSEHDFNEEFMLSCNK